MSVGACGSASGDHVYLLNGFDFPVTLNIELKSGGAETITVPARGKLRAGMKGVGTVTVSNPAGVELSKRAVNFGKPRKDGSLCPVVFNAVGSAALEQGMVGAEAQRADVPTRILSGETNEQFCSAKYMFEAPPAGGDAKGPRGQRLSWVQYTGDGGWRTSVEALLGDDLGRFKGRSHEAATRIVSAVMVTDPGHADLAALRQRFEAQKLVWPDEAYRDLVRQSDERQRRRAGLD